MAVLPTNTPDGNLMTKEERVQEFTEAVSYASAAILSANTIFDALEAYEIDPDILHAWAKETDDVGGFCLGVLIGLVIERRRDDG